MGSIPEGYQSVQVYLIIPRVAEFLEFVKQVFDASISEEPKSREDGTIMHAEVQLGTSKLMMGEPMGEYSAIPASMYVYVPDCDATIKKAIEAGAELIFEIADQEWGDRYGGIKDSWGNCWWIATSK
jgi:uncharacterized glyoxalase superfamily protein PhnB